MTSPLFKVSQPVRPWVRWASVHSLDDLDETLFDVEFTCHFLWCQTVKSLFKVWECVIEASFMFQYRLTCLKPPCSSWYDWCNSILLSVWLYLRWLLSLLFGSSRSFLFPFSGKGIITECVYSFCSLYSTEQWNLCCFLPALLDQDIANTKWLSSLQTMGTGRSAGCLF